MLLRTSLFFQTENALLKFIAYESFSYHVTIPSLTQTQMCRLFAGDNEHYFCFVIKVTGSCSIPILLEVVYARNLDGEWVELWSSDAYTALIGILQTDTNGTCNDIHVNPEKNISHPLTLVYIT